MDTGAPRPAPAEGAEEGRGRPVPGGRRLLSSRRGGPGPARLGVRGGGGGPLGSRARRSALNPARRPAGMAAAGAR